jgi:hypothetical protein
MQKIRRGDDHGIDAGMCDGLLVIRERRAHANFTRSALKRGRIAVAQRDDLRGRQRQPGQVIGQDDFPGADDGDADGGQ